MADCRGLYYFGPLLYFVRLRYAPCFISFVCATPSPFLRSCTFLLVMVVSLRAHAPAAQQCCRHYLHLARHRLWMLLHCSRAGNGRYRRSSRRHAQAHPHDRAPRDRHGGHGCALCRDSGGQLQVRACLHIRTAGRWMCSIRFLLILSLIVLSFLFFECSQHQPCALVRNLSHLR